MYDVRTNLSRQRMDIACDEALTTGDFERLLEAIREQAGDLQPGWTAAVDFRGMWVSDPFVNELFQRLQSMLLDQHAGKIGTLLEGDPLKMRLWQAGAGTGSNVLTRRFHDAAEWERFLAGS
jgi:hypothetical protein